MDFTLSLSSDWINILSLPLILMTLKDVIPNWKNIWDKDLTIEDRRLIMRMVIFLALPAVVFIHEMGHLLAALQVGAKVYEFHYGPVTGHVRVDANLPPEQLLWIAVAGNLAQIVVGIISLIMAVVVRNAALVVFLVYLGLFSIGDTVIFYAALSVASIYGDWIQIYESPCRNLVMVVGAVHAVLVAFVVYCIKGEAPRLWYTRKTLPGWSEKQKLCEDAVRQDPSPGNLLELAIEYVRAGLYTQAERCFKQAESAGNSPAIGYARAEMELTRGNLDKAQQIFEKLAQDETISSQFRAQLVMQIGDLWLYKRDSKKALECFQAASNLDEEQGDARLQKAILKANMGQYDGLAEDLSILKNGNIGWIYKHNQESAAKEIEKLDEICARHQGKTT